jgi:hypothetical protein
MSCQPPFGKLIVGTFCFAVDVAKRIPSGKCVFFGTLFSWLAFAPAVWGSVWGPRLIFSMKNDSQIVSPLRFSPLISEDFRGEPFFV